MAVTIRIKILDDDLFDPDRPGTATRKNKMETQNGAAQTRPPQR